MTGETLRNILKTIEIDGAKISLKNLAARLEMSEQNLQKRFKVQDIGVGFLQEIAAALNISLIELLQAEQTIIAEPSTGYKAASKKPKPFAERILDHFKGIVTEVETEQQLQKVTAEQTAAMNKLREDVQQLVEITEKRKNKPAKEK